MAKSTIPLQPNQIYHIYNHANGEDLLFRENENYDYFLKRLKHYLHPVIKVHAYCLLPNHFHLLIRVRNESELVKFHRMKYPDPKDPSGLVKQESLNHEIFNKIVVKQFGSLFNAYAKSFNKKYDRRGRLFERSFKRKCIDEDNYFTNMIRYIHFNPVLHRFVSSPLQWKYNSMHAYLVNKESSICRSEVFEWMGGRKGFEKFHQSIQRDEFDSLSHLSFE